MDTIKAVQDILESPMYLNIYNTAEYLTIYPSLEAVKVFKEGKNLFIILDNKFKKNNKLSNLNIFTCFEKNIY